MTDTTLYLVRCEFDPARKRELPELRAAHLRHILAHLERIEFGGLVGPQDQPPESIVLLVRAGSRAEVEQLIGADPYVGTWCSTVVEEFQRRLPETREGELVEALERLTAAGADGGRR